MAATINVCSVGVRLRQENEKRACSTRQTGVTVDPVASQRISKKSTTKKSVCFRSGRSSLLAWSILIDACKPESPEELHRLKTRLPRSLLAMVGY
jgi:hypothetical protein